MNQEEKDYYLNLDLWDHQNYLAYIEEQNKLKNEKFAESAKYKQYRRYMKNKKFQMDSRLDNEMS